jgi:hypothetical protein
MKASKRAMWTGKKIFDTAIEQGLTLQDRYDEDVVIPEIARIIDREMGVEKLMGLLKKAREIMEDAYLIGGTSTDISQKLNEIDATLAEYGEEKP